MRRARKRKGIAILIVLFLLALFMILVTAFLVSSGQFQETARAQATIERTGDHPAELLDRTMYQLLRDVNFRSSLQGHSLLGDLYGNDGFSISVRATVTPIPTNAGFLRIPYTHNAAPAIIPPSTAYPGPNPNAHAYAGRVLTVISGNNIGVSTRIVDSAPASAPGGPFLIVEAFQQGDSGNPTTINNTDVMWVNGAPFNGVGAGYNTSTANTDRTVTIGAGAGEVALMPHYSTYSGVPYQNTGPDESYDVPDFNNMFMAFHPAAAASSADIIPSFHRPALINYWNRSRSTMWGDLQLRRQVILRPTKWDHPRFSGSNPDLNPSLADATYLANLINGGWDVDNNRDGINDSIWIDPGLPPQVSKSGKRYRSLVAILAVDFDNRLNVNAHGNEEHIANTYQTNDVLANSNGPFANGANNVQLPRGSGYGPAEIYLGNVFSNNTNMAQVIRGRYDHTGQTNPNAFALPSGPTPSAGQEGIDDPIGSLKTYGTLNGHFTHPDVWGVDALALDYAGQPGSPASPNPVESVDDPYELDLSNLGAEDVRTGFDRPYTIAEMERLVRYRDFDAPALPDRLLLSAGNDLLGNNDRARNVLTVDSRHIPAVNMQIPPSMRPFVNAYPTIFELYAARLTAGGVTTANLSNELDKLLPLEIRRGELFNVNRPLGDNRDNNGNLTIDEPAEAVGGEQMWAGIGLPTNMAAFASANFNYWTGEPESFVGSGQPLITNARYTRQIHARHLYCMMMMLIDAGYTFPFIEAALPPNAPTGNTTAQELTSYRVAQWAINTIDFRDRDSICSPFEYDVNPFNGWHQNLDGDPSTVLPAEGRLIWGNEPSDALITESLAFHDRRVKDTDRDDGAGTERHRIDMGMAVVDDDDLDQWRIPQGSLFFEIYCLKNRAFNNPNLPPELYRAYPIPGPADGRLELGRLAPASADGKHHPVWRIAISEQTYNVAALSARSGDRRARSQPDSSSFGQPVYTAATMPTAASTVVDPIQTSLIPGVTEPLAIDRIVWFTNQNPATDGFPLAHATFYNQANADFSLQPGQYGVVGPRPVTHIGDRAEALPRMNGDSPQRISLSNLNRGAVTASGVNYHNILGAASYPTPATDIRSPAAMYAAANPPGVWMDVANTAPTGIGLNISEPLPNAYYREPLPFDLVPGAPRDGYIDPMTQAKTVPDQPFDDVAGRPLKDHDMQLTGTYEDVRTAFLQRLADPTLPWHQTLNPYITMDWATIDLTVFNGEDRETKAPFPLATGEKFDPQGTDDTNAHPDRFHSRERGSQPAPPLNTTGPNLYNPIGTLDAAVSPNNGDPSTSTYFWRKELKHTLGYLNSTMGTPRAAPAAYIGEPEKPFPWVAWNNRAFNNPYELMLVPSSSSARLHYDVSLINSENPYNPNTSSPATAYAHFNAPYRHLLNFFHTSEPSAPQAAAHFYRLFDMVETPSPFVGTETWYSPTTTAAAITSLPAHQAPFNRLSRFRDPGRINWNTMSDGFVWDGLMTGYPAQQGLANFERMGRSRRGYGAAGQPTLAIDDTYPTRFANPLRSSGSAEYGPLPNLRRNGAEGTILRSNPDSPNLPLMLGTTTNQHDDVNRNPYFAYRGISRLSNLVGAHSNVYGVWITIGNFELIEHAGGPSASHPDGYELGAEIGSDSGEIERHRAFYIIDRSKPVGYIPGQNLNVDRAVLLRRYIE